MVHNSRQRQKAETRAHLLEVAAGEFERLGFEAATIRGIAQAAGVGTGTVFVHFESKADLLHAVLHDELEGVARSSVQSLPPPPLRAQLHHLVAAFLRHFARRPDLYVTLLRESLITTGPWGARFREQVEAVGVEVVGLYQAARDRGELGPDASPEVATLAFFSFYYFLLIEAAQRRFEDIDGALRRLDLLLEQQLRGLATGHGGTT